MDNVDTMEDYETRIQDIANLSSMFMNSISQEFMERPDKAIIHQFVNIGLVLALKIMAGGDVMEDLRMLEEMVKMTMPT